VLVLSRRIGECIVIDGNITVTVIEVRGQQIRLGIEAPKEVPVWREEVAVRDAPGSYQGVAQVTRSASGRAAYHRTTCCAATFAHRENAASSSRGHSSPVGS
jgi:carbon storage regulator